MRKASRQIIFINTSPPGERVELLKPMNDIKDMDDDCEENYTSGLIKRYCKRPAKLENLTLADWAAWYDCSGKPFAKTSDEVDVDDLPMCVSRKYPDPHHGGNRKFRRGRGLIGLGNSCRVVCLKTKIHFQGARTTIVSHQLL